jgi:hypothetical protein
MHGTELTTIRLDTLSKGIKRRWHLAETSLADLRHLSIRRLVLDPVVDLQFRLDQEGVASLPEVTIETTETFGPLGAADPPQETFEIRENTLPGNMTQAELAEVVEMDRIGIIEPEVAPLTMRVETIFGQGAVRKVEDGIKTL